jgi:sugar/nucleoside kinase (ribokinase family)
MSRLDVIAIGHVTCDIICPLQGWPERDTKTVLPGLTLAGGGPSANAMAALARLGVPVGLVGRLGSDLLGRFARAAQERDGIDVSHIQLREDIVSPVSVILADLRESTRTILLTKGTNTQVTPGALDWAWLKQARVIHFDGHQLPASLAAAKAAQGWPDAVTVLDAGSMREGMKELCSLVDYVFCSSRFALELTGSTDPQQCLAALHELGVPIAGITLGSAGSMLSAAGVVHFAPAIPVETQDTTGAGDAFHGGFIFSLLRGYTLPQCLAIGNAVAALKCTGLGARQALPDYSRLQQFLADQPSPLHL